MNAAGVDAKHQVGVHAEERRAVLGRRINRWSRRPSRPLFDSMFIHFAGPQLSGDGKEIPR